MKMTYGLLAALGIAGVAAATSLAGAGVPAPAADPAPVRAKVEAPAPETPSSDSSDSVEGEILEVLDVPNYTYLRIGAPGTDGTWAAVPSTKVRVGEHARVADATKMTSFSSAALKRTFPVVLFGTLADARSKAPPATSATAAHAELGAMEVKPVERAPGPNGKTVAQVSVERSALAGKTIRVRGTVVKATPGVLGKTYLHLRDGTGDHASKTDDLVVTTTDTPAVGETILVEGVLGLDRDIGAGYQFATILEDARVVRSP